MISSKPSVTPAIASPPTSPPAQRPTWQRLQRLAANGVPHLRELLCDSGARRAERLHWHAAGITLDATHQAVTHEVLDALLALAAESSVREQAAALARGEIVNPTEGRAALHVALRAPGNATGPWSADIAAAVHAERERFLAAAERIRTQRWQGATGESITDVVNLGIGGSDLGPRTAVQALQALVHPTVRVHFVSNPDAWTLYRVLRQCTPARTLFIVQSKTFTTAETLQLAASARRWLADGGIAADVQRAHLLAVTAAPALAAAQGYAPEHTFRIWDWVGGRYSVWSAIGLPLAIAIGAEAFRALLDGAHAMDRHFWESPPARNLPLALALLGVWNRNFLGCPTHLLAIYSSRLATLAHHLQQLEMESNGKSVHIDGTPCAIDTGPIVWGGSGIDGQHAYFQLLHQGRHRVPVDFIGVQQDDTPLPLAADHQRLVQLSLRAQARALALGRDDAATAAELRAAGLPPDQVQALTPHRRFAGNVPSNILWLEALTPRTLGALLAAYEHKVFCQAAIWRVNPFDQWGVELGKAILRQLQNSPA
ncbi:glucose-6-phosphate isomerase [Tepidimonas charontis]|uniref:Glucose-6-phosphate isomerase n=1 Tax=Tepidimonas charontis TaxID=2267262 RepID=A0A554XF26_9BURK|nr:glucose-6-phosphate isomerase [Tepidimonas charontis]TSE34437.1 Glucose-6-phosphate isomerase [Tepidimonas charontis]